MTAHAPGARHDLRFTAADPALAKTLTPGQVERFNRDGYLSPIAGFDAAGVAANRALFDRLHPALTASGLGDYDINGFHTTCPSLWDLVTTPRLLDHVQDLIGPDIVCWGAHFFAKAPGDLRRVSWHQDGPYWPFHPARTVTAWLAIDDADAGNGAMRVVAGSHRHGVLPFRASAAEERNVLWLTVDEAAARGGPPVTLALRAGEFSLHSDLLLHGSEPNPSTRRRCGLAIRYVAAEVRLQQPNAGAPDAILCRGRDAGGHWGHKPRPDGDDVDNARRRIASWAAPKAS
jgi:hypothetical protein